MADKAKDKKDDKQAVPQGPKLILHFNTSGTIVAQDRKSDKSLEAIVNDP